jgi:hypothetical protein
MKDLYRQESVTFHQTEKVYTGRPDPSTISLRTNLSLLTLHAGSLGTLNEHTSWTAVGDSQGYVNDRTPFLGVKVIAGFVGNMFDKVRMSESPILVDHPALNPRGRQLCLCDLREATGR